jgi:NitT/TauT family transport system ATP-binding protein
MRETVMALGEGGGGPAESEPVSCATAQDVDFEYETGVQALKGLTVEIPAGQVTAVIGPSGCGKSTLLRLIAGLASPTAGQLTVPVRDAPVPVPISMVFQSDTLLPWMTVAQNVGLAFKLGRRGRRPKRDPSRIGTLLEMVGLSDFRDAFPYQLSGGMRRRVAFLCAVAPSPRLLLLDEPFSSLDEPTRVGIHQDVLRIVREHSMSVALVTHDLAEAITLSDRVVILSARPAHVVTVRDVPFGEDRNVFELRQHPDYLQLYGELWNDLSKEIKR